MALAICMKKISTTKPPETNHLSLSKFTKSGIMPVFINIARISLVPTARL